MKTVILAGGFGTRISEETDLKPKPMIEIGGKPILWHIKKMDSKHGLNEFVICCGYKGYVIKEYFANYFLHMSDITFDMSKNKVEIQQLKNSESMCHANTHRTTLYISFQSNLYRLFHLCAWNFSRLGNSGNRDFAIW